MRPLYLCAIALFANSLVAQSLTSTYQQVLSPSLDSQHVAAIENVRFHLDALQFALHDGVLALTEPVEGHVTAAIFEGHGELLVAPPPDEKAQVRRFLGQEAIAIPFTQALFRFSDDAALLAAIGNQARFSANPRSAGLSDIVTTRARMEDDQAWPDAARVLQGLSAPHPEAIGPFLADLKTDHYGWIQAAFDPLQQEEVRVHRYAQTPAAGPLTFDDVWTQFEKAADRAQGIEAAHKRPEVVQLDHFHLDVQIPHDLDMSAQAEFQLEPLQALGRGVFLSLDSNLRLTAASTMDGKPIEWIQSRDTGRLRPPRYQGDWLYLQLPTALDRPTQVRLQYHGKYVIQQVGQGNYFARSMGWYPLYPFGTPFHYAQYDLVFHCDKKDSVIATGSKVADTVTGNGRTEEFRSSVPLTVAGFAFGQYRERDASVALDGHNVQVEVFTNTQPDDLFRSISQIGDAMPSSPDANAPHLPPGLNNLNPLSLQPVVVQEVSNSIRFFDFFFGPYPYQKLAVANIPGSYGQGWPSLLYLSSLSFLDNTQLHNLGLSQDARRLLSQTFRAHETSHQWWGHLVSWASPRDQWLSEGFANGSALLYEVARFGQDSAQETLREWRRDLLQRNRFGSAPIDEGPVWLGERLSSTLDPDAYQTVVYDKGGYIFYMLRQMLLDARAKQPDARFIAMMRDFTQTYSGRAASTGDFKAIVEKHMTREMDLDGNHRMDWFFNQFVYGTGVPMIDFSYQVAHTGNTSQLTLRFHQEPTSWKELIPIYIHFGPKKDQWLRGLVRLTRPDETVQANLPVDVRSVVANEYNDLLAVVKQ